MGKYIVDKTLQGDIEMMSMKESQTEQKRDDIIQEFVNKGVYKIGGRQLYELNFYELMKEYTIENERK